MKFTIMIPVYNEERTIKEILRRVGNAETPGFEKEIIVVDDGSTDVTGEVLKNLESELGFILLAHDKNRGKGAAIKTALRQATGDLALIQDADLEYDPADVKNLLAAWSEAAPVVYGSRNLGGAARGYALAYLGGWFLTILANLLCRSRLTDVTTGYKLFPRDLLARLQLKENGFSFCEEATVKVLKAGYRIQEVPISYLPRTFAEGKKIRPRDAARGAWAIVKYSLLQ